MADTPSTSDLTSNTVVMVILCIFLPPVAVYLKDGAGKELIIAIIGWLLCGIPGIVYALLHVFKPGAIPF